MVFLIPRSVLDRIAMTQSGFSTIANGPAAMDRTSSCRQSLHAGVGKPIDWPISLPGIFCCDDIWSPDRISFRTIENRSGLGRDDLAGDGRGPNAEGSSYGACRPHRSRAVRNPSAACEGLGRLVDAQAHPSRYCHPKRVWRRHGHRMPHVLRFQILDSANSPRLHF